MNPIHFSSQVQTWTTPQDLFTNLNDIYNFTLDVAADAENTKCQGENKLLQDMKDKLEYAPLTGIFKWKHDIRTGKGIGRILIYAGTEAGCEDYTGYRYLKFNGKKYSEHRLAYFFIMGIVQII